MSEPRTFWLSFTDATRPKGDQFLGVVVIDVTPAMAAAIRGEVYDRFPKAQGGGEWLAAAIREAHRLGVNPGGAVQGIDISDAPAEYRARFPQGELLTRAQLEVLDV